MDCPNCGNQIVRKQRTKFYAWYGLFRKPSECPHCETLLIPARWTHLLALITLMIQLMAGSLFWYLDYPQDLIFGYIMVGCFFVYIPLLNLQRFQLYKKLLS